MENLNQLSGVFVALVTPLKSDFSPDLDQLTRLIEFLAGRGCHGILLLGTTGEGPSFSINERLVIYQAASLACQSLPGIRLLAGTGTPSLEDTIFLTRSAFDFGYDGVVVLPPYYYRKASDEGLFSWFSRVLHQAVPLDGALLGYHIPPVSGVSLGIELLSRLKDAYPHQFMGIKDSSGEPQWARTLGDRFGHDLVVLNGNDRLFSLSLASHASGCITAMANLVSPLLRSVWDNFGAGLEDYDSQSRLNRLRDLFDRYPPAPPLIKLILSEVYNFPRWTVKPPLVDFDPLLADSVLAEYLSIMA